MNVDSRRGINHLDTGWEEKKTKKKLEEKKQKEKKKNASTQVVIWSLYKKSPADWLPAADEPFKHKDAPHPAIPRPSRQPPHRATRLTNRSQAARAQGKVGS